MSEEQVQYGVGQLSVDEHTARILDRFFGKWFSIAFVNNAIESMGITRIFTDKFGRTISVLYKTSNRSDEVLLLELFSKKQNTTVDSFMLDDEKTIMHNGWIKTSIAQYLVFYIPELKKVHIFPMSDIKTVLKNWEQQFPVVKTTINGNEHNFIEIPSSAFSRFKKTKEICSEF